MNNKLWLTLELELAEIDQELKDQEYHYSMIDSKDPLTFPVMLEARNRICSLRQARKAYSQAIEKLMFGRGVNL